MAYQYTPSYVRQVVHATSKQVITAERWNELFNLLITQGDNTAEAIKNFLMDLNMDGADNIGTTYSSAAMDLQSALNLISAAIAARSTSVEMTTAITAAKNACLTGLSFNSEDGKFTINKGDGTTTVIDTNIEKIPASLALETVGNVTNLVITNSDGSKTSTNVSSLIDAYTFSGGPCITVTSNGAGNTRSFTFSIADGAIGLNKLTPEAQSTLLGYKNDAQTAAASALSSANMATAKSSASATSANEAAVSATAAAASATAASNSANSMSSSVTTCTNAANTASAAAATATNAAAAAADSAATAAAGQVNSDWNVTDNTSKAFIKNKPDFAYASHTHTPAQIGAQPVLTAGTNITISGNTISATGGLYPRIVVTAPTGSTVTCHRDSTTLTAVENSGTWKFDVPDYGTWTITATLGAKSAEDTVDASTVKLYNVAIIYIDSVFANNDWETIRYVVDHGIVPSSWNVGDFKPIALNGTMGTVALSNFQCSLQIVAKPGFNSTKEGGNILHLRFASTDGTKGLAFCDSGYATNTSNASKFNMNPTNVNTGGFWASTMNTGILGNTGTPAAPTANSLMSCLPQEVRDVMVQCTKYNNNTGGGADTAAFVTAKQYWIALPAEFEVFGARTYANSAEQTYQQQYPFFAAGNSKIHYRHDALTTAVYAWERSVYATNATHFGLVSDAGAAATDAAYTSWGVPPLLFI